MLNKIVFVQQFVFALPDRSNDPGPSECFMHVVSHIERASIKGKISTRFTPIQNTDRRPNWYSKSTVLGRKSALYGTSHHIARLFFFFYSFGTGLRYWVCLTKYRMS